MIYNNERLEAQGIVDTAAKMCIAARTAPKAKGMDNILTLVLTGEEKDKLADKIREVASTEIDSGSVGWFNRDAENLRNADAVVIIGEKHSYADLKDCSYCGFDDCDANEKAGGRCALSMMNLGIALGSAVSVAGDARVDNRIMFSIGKVVEKMGYFDVPATWLAIPLSATAKNIFFDR